MYNLYIYKHSRDIQWYYYMVHLITTTALSTTIPSQILYKTCRYITLFNTCTYSVHCNFRLCLVQNNSLQTRAYLL